MPEPESTETPTQDPISREDYNQAIAESKKYRKRAQESEAKITSFEGKILSETDAELFSSLKAASEKADEENAKSKGDFESLIAKQQAKHNDAQKLLESARDNAMSAYAALAITQPISIALAAAGVQDIEAASHLIQTLHSNRASATLVEGKANVKVVDVDGVAALDDKGKPLTITALVAGFLATDRGKVYLPPSGDSGSGAFKGGEVASTLVELDADFKKKQAFIEKHGNKAYMALVSKERAQKKAARENKA